MKRPIEQLPIELVVDFVGKAFDEDIARDRPGIAVIRLQIGRRTPPVHTLPGETEGEIVRQRADAHPILRRDGRDDALQPLD